MQLCRWFNLVNGTIYWWWCSCIPTITSLTPLFAYTTTAGDRSNFLVSTHVLSILLMDGHDHCGVVSVDLSRPWFSSTHNNKTCPQILCATFVIRFLFDDCSGGAAKLVDEIQVSPGPQMIKVHNFYQQSENTKTMILVAYATLSTLPDIYKASITCSFINFRSPNKKKLVPSIRSTRFYKKKLIFRRWDKICSCPELLIIWFRSKIPTINRKRNKD